MINEFPVIHTNIWDAFWAIPVILILTFVIKRVFHIPAAYVPTVATVLGLISSVFISHPGDLAAGIFMGFFYGAATIGSYAALKTSFRAYRHS